MNSVKILGVKIDDITIDQVLKKVEEFVKSSGKLYIVTPNPEFLASSLFDSQFKEVLNKADLAIPDGIGLKLSGKIQNTVTGTDLMDKMIKLSADKGFTIGLIGGRKNVAVKLKECLHINYPKLKIIVADGNFEVNSLGDTSYKSKTDNFSPSEYNKIDKLNIDIIFNEKIDILFVAFGHVKQEKWIYNNLPNLKIKIAMGVGGAIDYLSGSVPRAPKLLRNMGLEWLFRLILQPWRIKRYPALIYSLILILLERWGIYRV